MTKKEKLAVEAMKALIEVIEECGENEVEVVKEQPKQKETKKSAKKEKAAEKKVEAEETAEKSLEDMTARELYALCCEKGISSDLKDRKKNTMIDALKTLESGATVEEEAEDDWEDVEESEKEVDPYEGKTAKELFDLCKSRGITVKPKQKADTYVKLLKKADEEASNETDEEDDDDDWEI